MIWIYYVEHVAHQTQGVTGPGGSIRALHWQVYPFQYSVSSLNLWDAVAMKCPGVHPIGIGDALHQSLYKMLLWLLVLTWRHNSAVFWIAYGHRRSNLWYAQTF